MARTEICELTNMTAVCDGNKVLVLNRKDPNWHGITFPGGHVEPHESLVHAAVREVYEETGLTVEDPCLCGIKEFYFRPDTEKRYMVFLFRATRFSGELKASEEGDVYWVEREKLSQMDTVNDFGQTLELLDKADKSEFFGFDTENGWIEGVL